MSTEKKGGSGKVAAAEAPAKDSKGPRNTNDKGGDKKRGPHNRSNNNGPVIGSNLVRPSRDEMNVKVKANIAEITEFNNQIKAIREEITKITDVSKEHKPEQEAAKQLMSALQAERKQYMDERAAIIAERNAMKAALEGTRAAESKLRGDLKFKDLESLDAHLAELEHRQATTSMSLTAEKNLLKEIKNVQDSRKRFTELDGIRQELSRSSATFADFDKRYSEKMAQVDEVRKRETAHRAVMDKIFGVNSEARETIPAKYKAIDEIRAQITERRDEIQSLEAAFKKLEDEYFTALREERQKAEEARAAEAEKRKAEKEAREKEALEAELRKVPFEAEINLCDSTVQYLEKKVKVHDTFMQLNARASASAPSSSGAGVGADAGAATVTDNGKVMKLLKRDDYEEAPVGKAGKKGGKKKNQQAAMALGTAAPAAASSSSAAATPASASDVVTHDATQTGVFTFLTVTPPSTISEVAQAIEAIRLRKEHYQAQERNAPGVQTYAQFCKKEEKKAAQLAAPAASEKKTRSEDAPSAATTSAAAASASATATAGASSGKKGGAPTTVFTVEQLQSADLFPSLASPVPAAAAASASATAETA